jgi:predicted molibdopterin-dependent oxidoreductase YjgC
MTSSDSIKLTIDGKLVEACRGMTVLEVARSAGIYIPTLCYDPDLKPYGGCRLCVVEIEKMRGFPIACTTPATDGMVVRTDTPAVMDIRRTAMELILSDHPSQCLVCDRKERCGPFDICLRNVAVTERCVTCPKNDHCELQPIVKYLGITSLPFRRNEGCLAVDDSNPFYYRDLNKCILCAKCVRVCDEITGVNAIEIIHRGHASKIGTLGDKPVNKSNCVSCGECVVRCPVGALVPKDYQFPKKEVASTCTYCATGCGIYLGVRDGKLTGVRARREGSVNQGNLCVKGRFGVTGFVQHPDRLKQPYIKTESGFTAAGWDEALGIAAQKLSGYKPEEIAVVSSSRCTNEENYLAQKLARAVLGTNNVDQCARI